jgi:chromate transport protein ChrA
MTKIKRYAITLAALIISVLPPLFAALSYFPLWKERGAAALLSGWSLLLVILAASPILRFIRERLRSPSAWCVWLALFILFSALSAIAAEMKVISLIGFISNIFGAYLFKLAEAGESEDN